MSATTYKGSCLCGTIQFEVRGRLDDVDLCHCSQCRRANGGAFNVAVIVDTDAVTFLAKNDLREFSNTPGKHRAFCSVCGTPIYSRRDDLPDTLRLRGGTIVELPEPANMRHIYYASRWPWIDRLFETPKCDGL